ncbi:hypothetical protein [Pelotomaculum schinkii]|uniref:hypothetical protein n=1 Tax=Pelotomaculum schinkii TaxID=78350 RepID=UPI00167EFD09|nr:hypothetical protein [Pelotomaculum schinkii]
MRPTVNPQTLAPQSRGRPTPIIFQEPRAGAQTWSRPNHLGFQEQGNPVTRDQVSMVFFLEINPGSQARTRLPGNPVQEPGPRTRPPAGAGRQGLVCGGQAKAQVPGPGPRSPGTRTRLHGCGDNRCTDQRGRR